MKSSAERKVYLDLNDAIHARGLACDIVRKWGFSSPYMVFHKLIDDYTTYDYSEYEVKLYKLLNSPNGYAILRALLVQRGLTEQELK